MQWQFVISPIIGAIIGYITNWVAIKMLFRPLEEKRIFGIRVPFTPGVIPGERDRIAVSIGEAVSKYLLTEEQITSTLLERKTETALRRFIRINLYLLLKSEATVSNIIAGIVGGKDFINKMTAELCTWTHSVLLAQSTQNTIIVYLQTVINDFLEKEIEETITEQKIAEYALSINNTIKSFLSGQDIVNSIKHYIEQKLIDLFSSEETLGSHIPSTVIAELENQLSMQGPEIIKLLTGYLELPEIKSIIVQRLEKFFEGYLNNGLLGGMISGFIKKNSPKLAEKIFETISNFLLDENLQKELGRFMDDMLRSILNKKISEIAHKLHLDQESTRQEWVNFIYGQVMGEREIDSVLSFCENYLIDNKNHTWNDLFSGSIKKEFIDNNLANLVYSLMNKPELQFAVDTMVQAEVNNILDKKVSELTGSIKNKDIFELAELLVLNSQRLIPKYSPLLLKTINIKSTIQKSVDGLDVSEIENVLLGITNKELTYITWFGGLLGLVIGLATPLLELLIK